MIDFIFAWVRDNFESTTWKVYRQALPKDAQQKFIVVIDNGGTIQQYPSFKELGKIQIAVQGNTDDEARQKAIDIYEFIGEKYEYTLNSGNESLTFAKIQPIDRPIPLGRDTNGFQYSINFEFLRL